MRILLTLAALGIVGGCATPPSLINRDAETVTLTNSGDEIVAPPINFSRPVMRSYVPGPDGGWQEVSGAQCMVEVGPYRATVTPPVRLVVPDMRPAEIPLVATCKQGDYSGRAVFPSHSGLQGPYPNLSVGMKRAAGAS